MFVLIIYPLRANTRKLTRIKGLVRASGAETVTVGESLNRLLAGQLQLEILSQDY
jgi:hypothetical protein